MSYLIQKTLPSKEEVKAKLPLSDNLKKQVLQDREEIRGILSGKNSRKLLIIGPCSAWPNNAVLDYARKLAPLAKKYRENLKIVMRVYIQKPRTIVGWQGPIIQPDPFGEIDMPAGIFYCREMMLEVIKLGLPIADEILFPRQESYFRDLLSWAAIGARSSENQEHRILSSMLDLPIGMKNPTSGSIRIGINSVLSGQSPNYLALNNTQVKTSGNPFVHLVLRGGKGKPNISHDKLEKLSKYFAEKPVQNKSFLIDASHENSIDDSGKKNPLRQADVVWESLKNSREIGLKKELKGWMMESFLIDGQQSCSKDGCLNDLEHGKSVTDACLGWEKTVKFIEELNNKIAKND